MSSPSNETRPRQREVLPAVEARQGVTGNNVRYVLGWSLAAIVVAFGVIYFAFFGGRL